MNKASKFFYNMAMLPLPLYEKGGINGSQLSLILRTKLMMDDRHPNTFQQTRGLRKNSPITRATYGTMVMAFLMGLLYLVFFMMGRDEMTHLTLFFAAFLFMLASMLISDFTSVLIDVRDNQIILPRPVNDRTVLMAKLLHIMIHLARIVVPMSLPAMVFIFIRHGWQALPALLLMTMLASLLSIFFINAAYLLVLRLTTPEKFKSFIAWFQIGFAILLYGAYQLVPRVADMEEIQQFSITDYWYSALLPPYWFAGGFLFASGQDAANTWQWFLLAVFLTIASCWVVIRFLAPAFNSKLSLISGSGGEYNAAGPKPAGLRTGGIGQRLASILSSGPLEKAAFLFSWRFTGRSREFKLRIYPTLGYVVVWIALTVFRSGHGTASVLSSQGAGTMTGFLGLLYLSAFVVSNAILQVSYSEQYRAAWIFFSAPVAQPGPIISGTFKSVLCKFYLPTVILITLIGLTWYGADVIPNLVLGLSNELVICNLLMRTGPKKLPAALPPVTRNRSGSFLRALTVLLISGLVAGMHFLVYQFMAVVILLAVLSIIANWLLMNSLKQITWEGLHSEA